MGGVGEGEGNHTSCGSCLKELGFLARLQDDDPESLIGCWHRSGRICSAADMQTVCEYEDQNSFLWSSSRCHISE